MNINEIHNADIARLAYHAMDNQNLTTPAGQRWFNYWHQVWKMNNQARIAQTRARVA